MTSRPIPTFQDLYPGFPEPEFEPLAFRRLPFEEMCRRAQAFYEEMEARHWAGAAMDLATFQRTGQQVVTGRSSERAPAREGAPGRPPWPSRRMLLCSGCWPHALKACRLPATPSRPRCAQGPRDSALRCS